MGVEGRSLTELSEPKKAAPRKSDAAAADGLPTPRRYWAITVLMLGLTVTVLDGTMSNVALPAISNSLGIPASQTVWVVLAYSLTVVGCMLPLSALAERTGFQRMWTAGMVLFLLGSLSSSMSTSMVHLIISRMCQGLGAAMVMCLFGGIMRYTYPLAKLAAGLSLNAFMVGLMSVLGPSLGALILQWFTWPVIFLINVPLIVVSLFGVKNLPDGPRRSGAFDWMASALSAALFATALFGLESLGRHPFIALGCLVVAAILAWVIVRRSWGQPAPVVPIDLLRVRSVGYAVGASALFFAAQMSTFVSLPFYFKAAYGASYSEIGLYLGAWAVGAAVMAPVSAYMSGRYPVSLLCAAGASVLSLGLLGVLLAPSHIGAWWLCACMLMAGTGFGFFQTPNNRAMLGDIPRHRSGAAGGMQSTTRVFGQGIGTAFVGLAFQLSSEHGATIGASVAIVFALGALAVNITRWMDPTPDARF